MPDDSAYVPTLDEVRRAFSHLGGRIGNVDRITARGASFDRWHAQHDREVAALTRAKIEYGLRIPDEAEVHHVSSEERARRLAVGGLVAVQRTITEWRPL